MASYRTRSRSRGSIALVRFDPKAILGADPYVYVRADNVNNITSAGRFSNLKDFYGNSSKDFGTSCDLQDTTDASGRRVAYADTNARQAKQTGLTTFAQPYTVYLVVSPVSLSAAGTRDVALGSRQTVSAYGANTTQVTGFAGSALAATRTLPTGTPIVLQWYVNGASSIIRENGRLLAKGTVGASNPGNLVLGNLDGGTRAFDGYYYALLVVAGTEPSAAIRKALMTGLAQTYRAARTTGLSVLTANGNSISFGYDASAPGTPLVGNFLAVARTTWGGTSVLDLTNTSVAGNNWTQVNAQSIASSNDQAQHNVCLAFEGANDLGIGITTDGLSAAAAAAQSITRAKTACAARSGYDKVIVPTVASLDGYITGGKTRADFDATRAIYNATLLSDPFFSTGNVVVWDVCTRVPLIGANNAQDNATYYQSDKSHPTTDGHALMAADFVSFFAEQGLTPT